MKAQKKPTVKVTPKTKLAGNVKKGESRVNLSGNVAAPGSGFFRLAGNHNETLVTA